MLKTAAIIFSVATTLCCAMQSHPALAEVPIEISATGHATVAVTGEFGTHQFVFDTGAQGSAVYADFADRVGLEESGSDHVQGQTGSSELPLVQLRGVELDGVRKSAISAIKLPPRADRVALAGIVGLDLFGDRLVEFDLPKKRLSLLAAGHRPANIRSRAVEGSVTTGGLLTIPVSIGAVTATAVIDTGARKTRMNWQLGRLIGLTPDGLPSGETIYGATNNAVETKVGNIAAVQIGTFELANAPVLVADVPVFEAFNLSNRPAIILGLDWLASCRMMIDFPARLVWFEPS